MVRILGLVIASSIALTVAGIAGVARQPVTAGQGLHDWSAPGVARRDVPVAPARAASGTVPATVAPASPLVTDADPVRHPRDPVRSGREGRRPRVLGRH